MNKQFFAVIIVVLVAMVGLFSLTKDKSQSDNPADSKKTVQASSHTVGKGAKNVTLVEYGDFQCPACKAYYPLLKQVKAEYKDDIKFQFRHFPLVQIHPNAMIGARAAEAAGNQDKFFEMHDLLYENQDSWSVAPNPAKVLESYATQLGMNLDKFKADMAAASTANIINADIKEGQKIGANSTPTFAINGKKVEENPRSVDDFKKLIDAEIKNVANQQNR